MANFHLTGHLRGTDAASVYIVDGVIRHELPIRVDPASVREISGYIYPGLVDAHHHPGMSHGAEPVDDAEILRRLKVCRAAGVTLIRDTGSQRNACEATERAEECEVGALPKVLYSGRHIARFKRYTRYLAAEVELEDLVAEIQRQAAVSDGWIKLVGDWIDRSLPEPDLVPLWSAETLCDAVKAAHDLGKKVTVHTFAAETVQALLDAGVDGIEHGTGMSASQMVQARELGILLDPTVYQVDRFPEFAAAGSKFPRYQARMLAMHERLDDRLAQMVEAESLFVMGTDTAENIATRPLPVELVTAVAHGMPADVVMKAASYGARQLLGLPSWGDGEPADFVVYSSDPEKDITAVAEPFGVIIDGKWMAGASLKEEAQSLAGWVPSGNETW